MSGRDKPSTIQDQPLQLHFLESVPELYHVFLHDKPLPNAYHFILLLDTTLPSYQEIKKLFRNIMYQMIFPCYHIFFYFEDLESLGKDLNKDENQYYQTSDISLISNLQLNSTLTKAVELMGHCLIIRSDTNKDQIIGIESKDSLIRIFHRLKNVSFTSDEIQD